MLFLLRAFWADKQSSLKCVIWVVSYAVNVIWDVRLTLAFGVNAAVPRSRSVKKPELVGIGGLTISAGMFCWKEASSSIWRKEVSKLLKPALCCCLTVPSMAVSSMALDVEDRLLSLSGHCNIKERLSPDSAIVSDVAFNRPLLLPSSACLLSSKAFCSWWYPDSLNRQI